MEKLLEYIKAENEKYNKNVKKLFNTLFVSVVDGKYRPVMTAQPSVWVEIFNVTRREIIANKELKYCDEDNLLLDYRDMLAYYGDRERKALFMCEMMEKCRYLLDVKDIYATLKYLQAPLIQYCKKLEPSISVKWLKENSDAVNAMFNTLLKIKRQQAGLMNVCYEELIEAMNGKYIVFSSLLTHSTLQMHMRVKQTLLKKEGNIATLIFTD